MDKAKLEAKSREEKGRQTNKGRREGLIPAVVYGKKVPSKNLWVADLDFKKLLQKSGESVIIDLDIDGQDRRNVLIHEIQADPVKDKYLHIDFFQVKMDEKIETEVELVLVGEAPAVKELGGVLVKNVDKVKVKCFPVDLPSHIEVNVSGLATFADHVYVKDLKVSDKVEVEIDPETVVALVAPPRSEEELSTLEEKVEEDVTKVEGVVKEEAAVEGEEIKEKPKEEAKVEKKQ